MIPELLKSPALSREPHGSWLAHREAAERALQRALPGIEAQVGDPQVSGSGFLYVVVLDPGLNPGEASFEDAVLVEHAIGNPAQWDADYAAFARAKARLSWMHRCDGHYLQTQRAHWLRQGDTRLWGGVCLDGIVVGVSGAHPWFDEAFATTVAAYLRAEVKAGAAEAEAKHLLFAGP